MGLDAGPLDTTERLGPYRILETLGEGGMGVVYLAEQEAPIRRRVAIKVIKLGMDTHAVVSRFESERQALAMMDHPNIARVIDAGATPGGRPFFVMEYIAGRPITDYCDEHQLGTPTRLRLVIDVCAAVQHAHQKGIIHRDIKPSNVLVTVQDGRPVAKVIDFGVAKATAAIATAETFFTEHGRILGTPEYMSPEQASVSRDIDSTTDVYSLGVLLYEILSGVLPFDSRSFRTLGYDGMLRVIREVDPPRPSVRLIALGTEAEVVAARRQTTAGVLIRQLRGDLDSIVLRAIDKDRRRRYASASELAADLQRYLDHEAVVARPPSVGYRAKKFVQRNRGLVASVSVVIATLAAGLMLSLSMYGRADAARRQSDGQRYGSTLVAAETAFQQLHTTENSAAPGSAGSVPSLPPVADTTDIGLLIGACSAFAQQAEMYVQTEFQVTDARSHAATTANNRYALELNLRAKDYCLKALNIRFPDIARALSADPTRALSKATKDDVELLYWTAASWGRAVLLGLDRPELAIDLATVRAIGERDIALDEAWRQGAIDELMIALDSLPESLGGSNVRARQRFERAIALGGGKSPAPYLAMATGVALAAQDRAEFERLLQTALSIKPTGDSGTDLLMVIYQRRARLLLNQADTLFAK